MVAKVILETEQTVDNQDDVQKYTGRLERIFDTMRVKSRRRVDDVGAPYQTGMTEQKMKENNAGRFN